MIENIATLGSAVLAAGITKVVRSTWSFKGKRITALVALIIAGAAVLAFKVRDPLLDPGTIPVDVAQAWLASMGVWSLKKRIRGE